MELIFFLFSANCETPSLPHGILDGTGASTSWTGTFSCLPGFTLVGNIALKCRGGQWSGDIPKCAILDGCVPGDLPGVEHGRKGKGGKQVRNLSEINLCVRLLYMFLRR